MKQCVAYGIIVRAIMGSQLLNAMRVGIAAPEGSFKSRGFAILKAWVSTFQVLLGEILHGPMTECVGRGELIYEKPYPI